MVKHTW